MIPHSKNLHLALACTVVFTNGCKYKNDHSNQKQLTQFNLACTDKRSSRIPVVQKYLGSAIKSPSSQLTNALLLELTAVPDKYLQYLAQHARNGFHFEIFNGNIPGGGSGTAGVTQSTYEWNAGQRPDWIKLVGNQIAHATIHEVGHAIQGYAAGKAPTSVQSVFSSLQTRMSGEFSTIGSYAQTNSGEWWAELVSSYYCGAKARSTIARLYPTSYKYAQATLEPPVDGSYNGPIRNDPADETPSSRYSGNEPSSYDDNVDASDDSFANNPGNFGGLQNFGDTGAGSFGGGLSSCGQIASMDMQSIATTIMCVMKELFGENILGGAGMSLADSSQLSWAMNPPVQSIAGESIPLYIRSSLTKSQLKAAKYSFDGESLKPAEFVAVPTICNGCYFTMVSLPQLKQQLNNNIGESSGFSLNDWSESTTLRISVGGEQLMETIELIPAPNDANLPERGNNFMR